ncbi:hypothetical protein QAD02_003240 [Eretmocerus hayati]|uniref:Uncharacterized protein n=1 Tax=Eretmocerus hayati TaxID=131215 RepID=A0ACC2NMZ1_9HYME|nr:hypothetical protein QAD02_003240 [Eretmocerus hayati]
MPLQELLRRIEDLETGLQSVNVNIHILSEEAASTGRLISEQFALNSSTQNIIFDQSQISLRVQEENTKAVERLKALLNSQNQQIETLSKRLRGTENLLFSALVKANQTSENSLTDALLSFISEKAEEPQGRVHNNADALSRNPTDQLKRPLDKTQGEENQRATKKVKILQQDEPTNETRVVLCVFPKTPGCTPAGKVLPEKSQGPATSGTTPTARSSKRARENLIGAPAQSQKGKTFHSYVNEISIDIGSSAKKLKLSDWRGRNNGRNDDIHIQGTSDAVEHIETIGREDEKMNGIEPVEGEIIGPVERIVENIGPVEGEIIEPVGRIFENIGPVEGEIIGPVERIVENIGPVEGGIIGPVEEIVENIGPVEGGIIGPVEEIVENIGPVEGGIIGPVERIVENIGPVEGGIIGPVEEIVENIGPVEGGIIGPVEEIVENIGPVEGGIIGPVEEIVENIGPVEGGIIGPVEEIVENIGPVEGGIIGPVEEIVENIGPVEGEIIEGYKIKKPHTSLLTEEESGKPHTSLLTEEESGTFRDIDNIDYKLGQLEISPPATAAWDIFPIKINDQFKRRSVEMIHTRRKEMSQTGDKSSLRDLGYNWKTVDLLSKSEVDVLSRTKRKRSDSPGGGYVRRVKCRQPPRKKVIAASGLAPNPVLKR